MVVALAEGFLFAISPFFSDDWSEIISLCMRMIPGLIFICLFALNCAFLQAQKRFFISGFAPVLFNIGWMLAAALGHRLPLPQAMRFLSIGISCAFALQWMMTAFQVRKSIPLTWGEWFRPRLFSLDWRKMMRPMTLGIIGVGATQINSALDAIFSRISDLSGPAYLWYAIRVQQLPLALFGIALSGALLPPLSRAVTEGNLDRYRVLLQKALRHSAALLVPCTFGLLALGGPGLNLLYGHGDFHSSDVQQTLYCLWGYGLGLLPSVMILLMATGFYAQKSYVVPMIASLSSVIFHVILNAFLVFGLHLGAFSIAVSTSAAALMNCWVLARYVHTRLGGDVFSGFWGFFCRLSSCGLISAICTSYFGFVFFWDGTFLGGDYTRSVSAQCLQVLGMGTMFMALFVALSHWMQIKELFDFLRRSEAIK
jgi:putative peptidoglycan lipid II flippase